MREWKQILGALWRVYWGCCGDLLALEDDYAPGVDEGAVFADA
ncbi:Uncharacterised protein [Dermatophilus congolensis]|uniref:Uncharacterized protein n=1 Tax=Dermatophilus congolensis TaxID=1863 RepID=A0A239VKD1_9MICO|nr:Uncharacterised protein [Dermatophilus congolensis]